MASTARRLLAEVDPALAGRVAAYRAGYLPEERRALEAAAGRAAARGRPTNALELGVDIVGLDAVLLAGWPGTRASLWQQAGRAGRAGQGALVVLVGRDDPLDTYLLHHPEALFGRPVEATVFDPDNPYVLAPHLCAAAAELPLTDDDLPLFGPARRGGDRLVERGALRRRAAGLVLDPRDRACDLADLRGVGRRRCGMVEESTGRLLGTVDGAAAHATVHAGAVYVHQGETYLSRAGPRRAGGAGRAGPSRTTRPSRATSPTSGSLDDRDARDVGHVELSFGKVEVTNQVVAFLRRRHVTGEVLGEEPLDLPPRTPAHPGGVVDGHGAGAGPRPASPPPTCPARRTPPSTPPSACCRCSPPATGGTSAGSPPPSTRTPAQTTVFVYDGPPAAPASPSAATPPPRVAARDPRRDRRLRVPRRLPLLRAVAQVRQRQRPAGQGRRGPAARRPARRARVAR